MSVPAWVTDSDVDWTGVDPSVDHQDQIDFATDLLFEFAGRQYGSRTSIERPGRCYGDCRCAPTIGPSNVAWSPDWTGCSCAPKELRLAGRHVTAVASVLVDSAALTEPTNWVLIDGHVLVRVDGGTWPCCQPLDVPPPGRLQVTYTWGRPVPPSGVRAAATLTRELALGANPSTATKCRLPRSVSQLVRQGATISVMREALTDEHGQVQIGVHEVDLFLAAKSPGGKQRRRPAIASPDSPTYATYRLTP